MLAGAVPGLGGPGAIPNVAGAPDYVLYNGRISTVDEDNTEVQALAVRDGDIIATGTPSGVGFAMEPPRFLRQGDIVECEIDSIGTLRNPVETP